MGMLTRLVGWAGGRVPQDKIELASVKDGLVRAEERQRRLAWRHEVLQQRYESLSKERDELKGGLVTSVYGVQQQVGLENLILERKVRGLVFLFSLAVTVFVVRLPGVTAILEMNQMVD